MVFTFTRAAFFEILLLPDRHPLIPRFLTLYTNFRTFKLPNFVNFINRKFLNYKILKFPSFNSFEILD